MMPPEALLSILLLAAASRSMPIDPPRMLSEAAEVEVTRCLRPFLDEWETFHASEYRNAPIVLSMPFLARSSILHLCRAYIPVREKCLGDLLTMPRTDSSIVSHILQNVEFFCGPTAPVIFQHLPCLTSSLHRARSCLSPLIGLVPASTHASKCAGVKSYFHCVQKPLTLDCDRPTVVTFAAALHEFGCPVTDFSGSVRRIMESSNATGELTMENATKFIEIEAKRAALNKEQPVQEVSDVEEGSGQEHEDVKEKEEKEAKDEGTSLVFEEISDEKSRESFAITAEGKDEEATVEGGSASAEEDFRGTPILVDVDDSEEQEEGEEEEGEKDEGRGPNGIAESSTAAVEKSEALQPFNIELATIAMEASSSTANSLEESTVSELTTKSNRSALALAACSDVQEAYLTDCYTDLTDRTADWLQPLPVHIFSYHPTEMRDLCEHYKRTTSECLGPNFDFSCVGSKTVDSMDARIGTMCTASLSEHFQEDFACLGNVTSLQVLYPWEERDMEGEKGCDSPAPTANGVACSQSKAFLCYARRVLIECSPDAFDLFISSLSSLGCSVESNGEASFDLPSLLLRPDIFTRTVMPGSTESAEEISSSTTSTSTTTFPNASTERRTEEPVTVNETSPSTPATSRATRTVQKNSEATTAPDLSGIENVLKTVYEGELNADIREEQAKKNHKFDRKEVKAEKIVKRPVQFGSKILDGAPPSPPVHRSFRRPPLPIQQCTQDAREQIRSCISPLARRWKNFRNERRSLANITFTLFAYSPFEVLEVCDDYANLFLCAGMETVRMCVEEPMISFYRSHLGYACSPQNIGRFLGHYECISSHHQPCAKYVEGIYTPEDVLDKCVGVAEYRKCLAQGASLSCGESAIREINEAVRQFGCSEREGGGGRRRRA